MARLLVTLSLAAVLIVGEGCDVAKRGPTTPTAPTQATPPPAPTPPGPAPVLEGINGRYRGDLIFTERDTTSCGQHCWPARFTVMANLHQNGADVTGGFDVMEVIFSGGDVKGSVDTATGDDTVGRFRARLEPNDLGVLIVIDTKITAPDGGRFEGTFIFGYDVVWRGSATFTRIG
jgi:hypothetical protein